MGREGVCQVDNRLQLPKKYFRLLDVKKIPYSFYPNGNGFTCSERRFLQGI